MYRTKNIAAILLSSGLVALGISQQPSHAYKVNGGDINLNLIHDINRQLDPIKSKVSGHDFEAKITLLDRAIKNRGHGYKTAIFRFDVTNHSNKTLQYLKINNQKVSFKKRKININRMGLGAGQSFQAPINFRVKVANYNQGKFNLKNIQAGWWANGRDYETDTVPEPLTIFGTAAALGFGALFKKRKKKSA